MTDNPRDKKVDKSWKKKAREEKDSLAEETEAAGEPQGAAEEEAEAAQVKKLPPATFLGFVSELAAQAFMYLGLVENPITAKKEKNLDAAGHLLDTLGVLEEKTRGNLTPEEESSLKDMLYALRMQYVKEKRS